LREGGRDAGAKPREGSVTATAGRGKKVTVRSGDTLAKIAAANGVSGGWQQLQKRNGLANPNVLAVGDLIDLG